MDEEALEEEFDLEIKKETEDGHSHTTFLGIFRGEKAIIKHSEDDRAVREKEALEVTEENDIPAPELLHYTEKNGDHVLITKHVDFSFPSRQRWKDLEFCRDFVESAANILSRIQSEKLMEKASRKEAIPENRDRALNAMKAKNQRVIEEVDGEAAELAVKITEKLDSDHLFTHGDFSTENILIAEDGIEAVVDWAEAGFTSRLRDIALFESAFIDEYVRFFHPEEVENIRKKFRSIVKPSSTEKLEMYRFHQNAVVLAFIRQGRCSEEWRRVGTVEEIERHRQKILKDHMEEVKEILS